MKQALKPYGLSLLFLIGFLLLFSFLSAVYTIFRCPFRRGLSHHQRCGGLCGHAHLRCALRLLVDQKKRALPEALLMSVILMICMSVPEGSAGPPDPCRLSRRAVLHLRADLTHDPHSS